MSKHREKIAEIQHEIWTHWMSYLFTCGTFDVGGNFIIPAKKVKHWQRQVSLNYSELSEREKDSDREQADKILYVLKIPSWNRNKLDKDDCPATKSTLLKVNIMAEQSDELKNRLFNKLPSEISELEANLLLEQYKLYVQMQDKVSERRHTANSFFLTLNTGLLTVIAAFVGITRFVGAQFGWIILTSVAGIMLCLTWARLIESYKQLNTGKFIVIHLLETHLPANMYRLEWDILGEGDGTEYKPFTRTEILVPIVFAVMYALVGVVVLLFLIFGNY